MSKFKTNTCLPYDIQIITDTLYYTIIKVIIKGNIRDPILLVAPQNLIGSTIQSTIQQFGGGLPNLPDINCVAAKTKFTQSKCCNWTDPSNRHKCVNNNVATRTNPDKVGSAGQFFSKNDLVGFYPSQNRLDRLTF